MCGRFTLRSPADDWCQLFLPDIVPAELPFDDPPRYNIAPTQPITCILRNATGEPRSAVQMRWGLIPTWAKDASIGNRMINARGETVDSKPSFQRSFAARRCLIPADGYYEWMKTNDGKQPYLIEPSKGGILAMAGLWDSNGRVTEDGTEICSCTIITTESNQDTAELHDRMPVFLEPENHDRWLDPGMRDTEALKALLRPAPTDSLKTTAISRHVNNPRHEDPTCVVPV
ncbi:MAG: SOS response-associated peptidase [Planctomycetota bacterium]